MSYPTAGDPQDEPTRRYDPVPPEVVPTPPPQVPGAAGPAVPGAAAPRTPGACREAGPRSGSKPRTMVSALK